MPVPGRNVAVLVDHYDLSRFFSEFEFEREAERIDVSTFGRKVRSYLSGPQESTVTLTGYYDGGADEVDEIFHNRFGQEDDVLITLCPDTALDGKPCYLTPTTETTYNVSTEVEEAVEIEAEMAVAGAVDRGHILKDSTAVTATGTGTAHDHGADNSPTVKGLAAHLHVLSIVGGTTPTLVVKVQHSDDDTTYTDLVTFDSVTGPTSARKTTAETATVEQYIKASHTITGTPTSVSYVLAAGRMVG